MVNAVTCWELYSKGERAIYCTTAVWSSTLKRCSFEGSALREVEGEHVILTPWCIKDYDEVSELRRSTTRANLVNSSLSIPTFKDLRVPSSCLNRLMYDSTFLLYRIIRRGDFERLPASLARYGAQEYSKLWRSLFLHLKPNWNGQSAWLEEEVKVTARGFLSTLHYEFLKLSHLRQTSLMSRSKTYYANVRCTVFYGSSDNILNLKAS